MLALVYVTLRFIHFGALMLIFGNALYSVWFAPSSLQRLMLRRFQAQQKMAALISLATALLMFAVQGGMMGNGWPDVLSADIWRSVLGTQFGGVWLWQIILAIITAGAAWLAPQKGSRLLLLAMGQFVLLAGVGHAAMDDGAPGALHRLNHAIHLLCAATWLGGLLPLLFCMRLSSGRWQTAAVYTMMRFSRVGHYAVAGVIFTGIINALFITGIQCALADGLRKNVVVQMCAGGVDGGNCAGESVFSGATLSPGYRVGANPFYQDDTGRSGAGRVGTGHGQSVCDLGTLLTRFKDI
jgi:Putative copper export protein